MRKNKLLLLLALLMTAATGAWADEVTEIVFTGTVTANALAADATFTVDGSTFSATIADDGNKMEIDADPCRFGTSTSYKSYTHRLRSNGASSSTKNYITLNIPEAGKLRIAPRTGSNNATDRKLVITQGGTELYNEIVQESQAVTVTESGQNVKVYPYVEVDVTAGSVRVSYTAGMNFYSFGFVAASSGGGSGDDWISGITNGDFSGNDVSSFCKKVYPSTDVEPVVIGANVGKDGTPGIVVKSGDDTANPNAQPYDTQFWIVLPEEITAGSSIRVQFDYKASKAAKASTEFHADPKSYLTWNAIGDVNFTTEWRTFNGEFTVPNDADGMKSIAFDLQHEKSATDYYFDNFSVSYKKTEWTNIIVNSDMEGTDVPCFYVKENAMGSDNIYLAHITDGIGKDDSRAIRVRSTGTEENTYDTQFFIRLPYELPASTMYRLSFDYKAGKDAKSDFQCANEPKEYIIWYIGENDTEDFSFTTEWQHYKKVYNVPSVCNGEKHSDADWLDNFQTIYFSLAVDGEATEYIIDNVKVEILNSVLSTLTPSPVTDPKLMIPFPPYTVSLDEGTVDADKWTITPAEGAYEGETVTVTYTGTKKVIGVKAEKKTAELPKYTNVVTICEKNGDNKYLISSFFDGTNANITTITKEEAIALAEYLGGGNIRVVYEEYELSGDRYVRATNAAGNVIGISLSTTNTSNAPVYYVPAGN